MIQLFVGFDTVRYVFSRTVLVNIVWLARAARVVTCSRVVGLKDESLSKFEAIFSSIGNQMQSVSFGYELR